jgi:hypothetical protein
LILTRHQVAGGGAVGKAELGSIGYGDVEHDVLVRFWEELVGGKGDRLFGEGAPEEEMASGYLFVVG